MRRRVMWACAVLALAVGAAAGGWWAGSRTVSSQEAAARAAPPEPSLITTPVVRKVLTSQLVVRGTAEPAGRTELSVPPPVDALPVVTAIPTGEGDEITNAQVVLEIAERPLFVFEGELPAFRTLRVGARGDDVAQLEVALAAAGLAVGAADGVLDEPTAAAIADLYRAAGYPPPAEDGDAATVLPLSEYVFVDGLPRPVDAVLVGRGDRADGPVLRVATDAVEIATSVAPTDRPLVETGAAAEIHLDDLGVVVPAEVASVGDRPMDGSPDYELIVRPTAEEPPDALDRAIARIVIPIESTGGEVLVVPVAALSAGADGSARVEVADGAVTRVVPVVAGLTAGGEVAVTPVEEGDLAEGDRVVVGE